MKKPQPLPAARPWSSFCRPDPRDLKKVTIELENKLRRYLPQQGEPPKVITTS